MEKQRNFNNQVMQHLRHYHPELMTSSGDIDATKAPTGEHVARVTTRILVQAGILQRNSVQWEDKDQPQ